MRKTNLIKLEFTQDEIEKIQYFLGESMKLSAYHDNLNKNVQNNSLTRNLSNIKDNIQHKIECHKARGEWK